MSATMSLNGHPRKQLSDQLDRLDGILDVLGEGLNSAVADAMKNGTRVAVKEALVEILTNGEFLAAIRGMLPTPTVESTSPAPGNPEFGQGHRPIAVASGPGFWNRVKAKLAAAGSRTATVVSRIKSRIVESLVATKNAIRNRLIRIRQTVVNCAVSVTRVVTASRTLELFIQNVKRLIVIAVGVGVMVGFLSVVAPQLFATFASGLTAALTVMGMQRGMGMPYSGMRVTKEPRTSIS
ncbi:MAG: hypothetical protein U0798_19290 [Gemmataceae bacterium]